MGFNSRRGSQLGGSYNIRASMVGSQLGLADKIDSLDWSLGGRPKAATT